VDGAGAGAVLLPAAAGLAEVDGAAGELDDELDDELQPAASPTQISAAIARPTRRFPLPEGSTLGNTPVPPLLRRCMRLQQV
jgi:hypothetical protein